MQSLEAIVNEFRYLARCWRPNILYRSKTAIIFREVEDLIAWVLRHNRRILSVRDPAWRFVCREGDGQNRYYYMIEVVYAKRISEGAVNPFALLENGDAREVKLIAGDATDYSGHGSHDKALAETFIERVLRLRMKDRDASYLIDQLIAIAAKEG